ncbi:hypothetical protein N431DRAFT_400536 [Stipitochalara longipes BDJ]|nr:hypothetical protein N431DRAFT_400536 [Stipitochalara longipes BDJ]
MTRLAWGIQQFARRVGYVRWDYRRYFVRTFSGAENKQKPHVQNFSSHREPALSPEEEQVFESQFSTIWKGMMDLKKKPEWEGTISRRQSDVWFSRISSHIPVDIKRILISPHPPTPAKLKSLEWSDTPNAGVFIWWTEVSGKQESGEKTVYVYVGSASNHYGGLISRKHHMLSGCAKPHDEALKRKIKDLGLSPKGQFGTLFAVPFKNSLESEVLDVRALSILTRLLLMIWLGAVGGQLKSRTKHLVPWKPGKIRYIGLATDNPLLTDINKGGKLKRSGKGRVKRRVLNR